MFAYNYIYEHQNGIGSIPVFAEEEYLYMTELVWFVDIHCEYRTINPTETGMMFKSVWKTKEERDIVHSLFPRGIEIMHSRGKATIEAGGSYRFEIEEILE